MNTSGLENQALLPKLPFILGTLLCPTIQHVQRFCVHEICFVVTVLIAQNIESGRNIVSLFRTLLRAMTHCRGAPYEPPHGASGQCSAGRGSESGVAVVSPTRPES